MDEPLSAGLTRSRGPSRPRLALAILSLILFLTFLDNTVVSVVLADVQSGLNAGVSALQWVVNGYAMCFAGLMLTAGSLGDLFGRKRVMLAGVGIFCAGSIVSALAPESGVLIAGRVIMGAGAAASEPGTLSMIRHLWPDRQERARALGVWVATSGLALALGPVIGGVLAGLWNWRAIFWFNLLFGLLALIGAVIVLPENADPGHRLDLAGSILGAGALASVTVGIISGEAAGYSAWWIEVLFAGAAGLIVAFILVEHRAANPVLNLRFFRQWTFTGSNVVAFATFFSIFSIFFFVALYLQIVANQSGYRTAVDFIPMSVAMVGSSLLTGRWVAATGPRMPMTVGCLVAAAGVLLTDAFMSPHVGFDALGWTLPIAGIGFGVALVPVTSGALGAIPPQHSGMAASATNTSRELGAVAGVAILGSIVNGQLTVQLSRRLAAIGIPKSFRETVITAVTTGNVNQSEAASVAHGNQAITQIIDKVISAAYGAFGRGLDLSLRIAGGFLIAGALIATASVRRAPEEAGDEAGAVSSIS